MKRQKRDFDTLVENGIRAALKRTYEKDSDWLKALEVAKDWSKVKHKIDDKLEGWALTEDEPADG